MSPSGLQPVSTYVVSHSAWCVRWIAESLRPPYILKDRAFLMLVKTGHLGEGWYPSPWTTMRDLGNVDAACQQRIASYLQVSIFRADQLRCETHERRTTTAISRSPLTVGPLQTIAHLLHSMRISSATSSLSKYRWISWRYPSRTLARLWRESFTRPCTSTGLKTK